MATEAFEVFTILPTSPEVLYAAWLDSKAHSAFTGEVATVEPIVGGRFMAWGGYISGTNQELEPGRRILQSWRTTEFSTSDPDSVLEVIIEPHDVGTRLTLRHSQLPEGQGKSYEQGWHAHYFVPMAAYFGEAVARKEAPAKSKAPKAKARKMAARAKTKSAPAKRTKRVDAAKAARPARGKRPPAPARKAKKTAARKRR